MGWFITLTIYMPFGVNICIALTICLHFISQSPMCKMFTRRVANNYILKMDAS